LEFYVKIKPLKPILRKVLTIEPQLFILLGAGPYLGWNIGAKDTANCIGTTIGCGLISYKRAVILVVIFSLLGAVLQGDHVMKTIGKGIVKEELNATALFVAMICSGFFVTLATFYRIPTSTSQAVVGGVVGIGLAVGAEVNFAKLVVIAESWIVCPVLVSGVAVVLNHLVTFILLKIHVSALLMLNTLGRLAILSACYVAYAMGANNAGNAVGPIANLGVIHPKILLGIAGLAIVIGAATYGRRVADTVGKGITPLDVQGAFVAQFSSAIGMHFFSILGIPVSTSSAIIGAVVGVGLIKGTGAISRKTLLTILSGWVLTPTLAAATAFLVYQGVGLVGW